MLPSAPRVCPVVLQRGSAIARAAIPAALHGYLPQWFPSRFGVQEAFSEAGLSSTIWSDATCREISVSFRSGASPDPLASRHSGSWVLLYDKAHACGNSILGQKRCIEYELAVQKGAVNVQTIGLSLAEAERVVRSISPAAQDSFPVWSPTTSGYFAICPSYQSDLPISLRPNPASTGTSVAVSAQLPYFGPDALHQQYTWIQVWWNAKLGSETSASPGPGGDGGPALRFDPARPGPVELLAKGSITQADWDQCSFSTTILVPGVSAGDYPVVVVYGSDEGFSEYAPAILTVA
jgi:hypothetical protein